MVADDENDQSASRGRVRRAALRRRQAAGGRPAHRRRRHQRAARRPRASWSRWPASTTCCRSRSCSTCPRACAASATPPARTATSAAHVVAPPARRAAPVAAAARRGGLPQGARAALGGGGRRRDDRATSRCYNDRRERDRPVRRHRRRARLPRRAGGRCWPSSATDRPRRRRPRGRRAPPGRPHARCSSATSSTAARTRPACCGWSWAWSAPAHALCVSGNHEQKLLRALRGRKVQVSHGLAESLAQLAAEPEEFRKQVAARSSTAWSRTTSSTAAGSWSRTPGCPSATTAARPARVRSFALYGDTTGETDEYGLPVRYPWANDYRGAATVVYGHTPDAGRGVGQQHDLPRHRLRVRREADRAALPGAGARLGRRRAKVWYEPVAAARPGRRRPDARAGDVLDIADVTGKRSSRPRTTAGSPCGRRTRPPRWR